MIYLQGTNEPGVACVKAVPGKHGRYRVDYVEPTQENSMQTVTQALELLKRQSELEAAMQQPGGVRVTEEQELHLVRRHLQELPEASQAVIGAAHALRRLVTDVTADEVEQWATTRAFR